jgi:hypothetical protein
MVASLKLILDRPILLSYVAHFYTQERLITIRHALKKSRGKGGGGEIIYDLLLRDTMVTFLSKLCSESHESTRSSDFVPDSIEYRYRNVLKSQP